MALRARLVAPPPAERDVWPYHQAKVASLPIHLLWGGDRRMEAETYLASGYGIRLAIQEREHGWVPLNQVARVWQPNRLKGIQVSPAFGTPFLAATQVFDIRPVPRKWLALERTHDSINRFVKPGMILVTCSGAVGRSTLATSALASTLISHDLLRVESKDDRHWGWVYAFLRSPQARAMMGSAQYGHIIKHLETSHLDALPIPDVSEAIAEGFRTDAKRILELRNRAHQSALAAETLFEASIGSISVATWGETGFAVSASTILSGKNRRMDGAFHNPGAAEIRAHLQKSGKKILPFEKLGFETWVPNRYQRIPAESGVDYYDSSDLLEINPESVKRFMDNGFGDRFGGRVQKDWILMPSSGQVYGIIGSAVLAGPGFDGNVFSNHVLRIAPTPETSISPAYLQVALSHPLLGRPLIKALAFGSSVPEIDPMELARVPIARLGGKVEGEIAAMAESVVADRAKADELERAVGIKAGDLIDAFIAGKDLRKKLHA